MPPRPSRYRGGQFKVIPPAAAAIVNLPKSKGRKTIKWAGEISTTKRQLMRLARKANHEHR
jgi:hypothetical protein